MNEKLSQYMMTSSGRKTTYSPLRRITLLIKCKKEHLSNDNCIIFTNFTPKQQI